MQRLLILLAVVGMAWSVALAGEAPDSGSINGLIRERDNGNWRGVLEYFEKFSIDSPLTGADLKIWDAYFYLRAETWLERSQQWTNPKAARVDAQKTEQAASAYLNWYVGLKEQALTLPRTPEDSPFAEVSAPGRVRFGAAIYGNALLAQGAPDRVIVEFAKFPPEWIGIEVVRIWKSAATYEYAKEGGRALGDEERIKDNLSRRPETAAALKAFTSNVRIVAERVKSTNKSTPKDWELLVKLCAKVGSMIP